MRTTHLGDYLADAFPVTGLVFLAIIGKLACLLSGLEFRLVAMRLIEFSCAFLYFQKCHAIILLK